MTELWQAGESMTFDESVADGPAAVARYLLRLTREDLAPPDALFGTVEDVALHYARSLNEVQRSCTRDGIVAAIERVQEADGSAAISAMVDLASLASQIQLGQSGGPRVQDRLMAVAAHLSRTGRTHASVVLHGYIAVHGKPRPIDFWLDLATEIGPPSLPTCFAGLKRHGVVVALTWARCQVPVQYQNELASIVLPHLLAEEPEAVRTILEGRGLDLKRWLQHQMISLRLPMETNIVVGSSSAARDAGMIDDYVQQIVDEMHDEGALSGLSAAYKALEDLAIPFAAKVQAWNQSVDRIGHPASWTRATEDAA